MHAPPSANATPSSGRGGDASKKRSGALVVSLVLVALVALGGALAFVFRARLGLY